MTSKSKRFKKLRDLLVPILVEYAYQQMLQIYKPGMVEPLDTDIRVDCLVNLKGLRTIRIAHGIKNFIATYKISIPFMITVKECQMQDLFQEGVDAKTVATNSASSKVEGSSTLFIYLIDFWLTESGEVWKEMDENLWRNITNLPSELIEQSLLEPMTLLYPKRPSL